MFNQENDEMEDFKKKREEYSINIRRNIRQEMFNKRRNMTKDEQKKSEGLEDVKHVIDLNYTNEIKQLQGENYSNENVAEYINMLSSSDILTKHKGAIAIRMISASEDQVTTQKLIQDKAISKYIGLLNQQQYPQLKYQIIFALANMSYVQGAGAVLGNKGLIEIAVKLVCENQVFTVDHALTLLGNITAESTKLRDNILKAGGLQAIYNCLNQINRPHTYLNCIWLICNFLRGSPHPNFAMLESSIPILCRALNNMKIEDLKKQDTKIIGDILWGLYSISDKSKPRLDRIIEAGSVPYIMKCAMSSSSEILYPALRIVGSLANQSEKQTEVLITNGVFDLAMHVLNNKRQQTRSEMCWALSNIASSVSSHVDIFLTRTDVLDKLNSMLYTQDLDCRSEICWMFANFGHLGNKNKVLQVYLHYDIMKTFVQLLDQENAKFLEQLLKVMYRVLMVGNKCLVDKQNIMLTKFMQYQGVARLERLQGHQSGKVYKCTLSILSTFFDIDEATD